MGIRNNNATARQADLDLSIETKRQDELNTLDSLLKALVNEKILFDSHFAKSSDVVPFLNTLEQLASNVGAKAEVYAVEQKTDTEGANSNLVVGIRVLGSFESTYKFITLLENAPYELEILSMNLEKISNSQAVDDNFETPKWSSVLKVKLISFIP